MKHWIGLTALALAAITPTAQAQFANVVSTYEVTITNITRDQRFTPVLVATHSPLISFFEVGQAPSDGIAAIAEGGDTSLLEAALLDSPQALQTATTEGLLGPGESATVTISSQGQHFNRLSLAAMLLPTNDTFVAINNVPLPRWRATFDALAYDAGSEENDELCANIPGPTCGGEPLSEGLGEGFIHISAGIAGHGDLAPEAYDWRGPVARVTIMRIE